MKDVKIIITDLTIEEVNTIIFALGNRPYKEVFTLIDKIDKQANEQVKEIKKD